MSGYLIEEGVTVPDIELSGAWDQELLVKNLEGKKQTLWKYKEPAFLDTRYVLKTAPATHPLAMNTSKLLAKHLRVILYHSTCFTHEICSDTLTTTDPAFFLGIC